MHAMWVAMSASDTWSRTSWSRTAVAVLRDVDEIRRTVHSDGGHDCILFGVDHADIIRLRVHYIDLVPLAIDGDSGGRTAHTNGLRQLKRAQVDDAYRIAFAVRDVGVLTVSRTVVGDLPLIETPPSERPNDGEKNKNEEELLQARGWPRSKSKVNKTAQQNVP